MMRGHGPDTASWEDLHRSAEAFPAEVLHNKAGAALATVAYFLFFLLSNPPDIVSTL